MTYKVQVDDIVRDATSEEAAQIDAIRNQPSPQDRIDAVAAAKQSARAKLAALGLTNDEIAALVG